MEVECSNPSFLSVKDHGSTAAVLSDLASSLMNSLKMFVIVVLGSSDAGIDNLSVNLVRLL